MTDLLKSNHADRIAEAKNSFNRKLSAPSYQKVLSDDDQRERLIQLAEIDPDGACLDLATGTGYMAVAVAERYPNCAVVGIDIADEIIAANIDRVREQGLTNITFRAYDGITLPGFGTQFDVVICRYALHHLPNPTDTLRQIRSLLKDTGRLVISDAVRNEHDREDFINRLQSLKKNGHVRMYTRSELIRMLRSCGFAEVDRFDSHVSFSPEQSSQCQDLLETASSEVKSRYAVEVSGDETRLRLDIFNVAFTKDPAATP